jgi:hypothetical protein
MSENLLIPCLVGRKRIKIVCNDIFQIGSKDLHTILKGVFRLLLGEMSKIETKSHPQLVNDIIVEIFFTVKIIKKIVVRGDTVTEAISY